MITGNFKFNGGNSIAEAGSFKRLPAGGYVVRITGARYDEIGSQRKYDVLVVGFDICEGEYKDYYKNQWEADKQTNPDAKSRGVFNIFLPNASDDVDRQKSTFARVKANINAIFRSNDMAEPDWEGAGLDIAQLRGKTVGLIMREREYQGQDGSIKTLVEPLRFTSAGKIRANDFTIPEKKCLQTSNAPKYQRYTAPASKANPLSQFEEVLSDGDVPF